ncbi:MFS transporter [Sphingobium sp.]|uniref:MFS transporter n=1 Tax=Sphingobium sp. TaxID=1912891 RepID=UPI0028BE264E|nr:MFS transporter [Sphingobium sp.]
MAELPMGHDDSRSERRSIVPLALTVAVASFMQMLDSAVIAVALPDMARSFSVTAQELGIGITAYVLAAAIVIPVGPWLADRFGGRKLFILALLAFVVTSIFCGLSPSLPIFVLSRFLQGMAGALMGPVGQLILVRSTERHELLRVMNISSAPMLLAPVIGPPLGGFIATYMGWPWIFYLNIPIGLAGALAAYQVLPDPRGEGQPFDYRGLLLSVMALGPMIFGLSELGGHQFPTMLALALLGCGTAVACIAIGHFRRAAFPLISLQPAANRTFALVTLIGAPLARIPIASLPFILPILLQIGFGYSAFVSGLLFLGHTGGDLTMKPFVTRVFRTFGHRQVLIGCTIGMCLAIASCALFTRETPLWLMAFTLYISGCFRSFLMAATGSLSFAELEQPHMASATTILQISIQLSQALGISAVIAIFDLSLYSRGAVGIEPWDCQIALILISLLGLASCWPFLKLRMDVGAEQSGYGR